MDEFKEELLFRILNSPKIMETLEGRMPMLGISSNGEVHIVDYQYGFPSMDGYMEYSKSITKAMKSEYAAFIALSQSADLKQFSDNENEIEELHKSLEMSDPEDKVDILKSLGLLKKSISIMTQEREGSKMLHTFILDDEKNIVNDVSIEISSDKEGADFDGLESMNLFKDEEG